MKQTDVCSVAGLASRIPDEASIAIGGFLTTNKPIALLRQLAARPARGLTVIACHASLDIELLVEAGCVRRLIVPYVGFEGLASVGPLFREAAQRGAIEIWDIDAGMLLAMLRAAQHGIPFAPVVAGVGTTLPAMNPLLRQIQDPFSGRPLLAVQAIQPDFALLHVPAADRRGNLRHGTLPFADALLAKASRHTFATCEELIDLDETARHPGRTSIPGALVDAVAEAPDGARPLGCESKYPPDEAALREILHAGAAPVDDEDVLPLDAPLTWREVQALFVSRRIEDGQHVVVGTNLPIPRAGVLAASRTRCPNLRMTRGFAFVRDTARRPLAIQSFFDSAPPGDAESYFDLDTQFGMSRRIDWFFIGALQVDPHGNSNLSGIRGPDGSWQLRGPGPIGTTTLATYARRYMIVLNRHDTKGLVAQLAETTAPGYLDGTPDARRLIGFPGEGPAFLLTPLCIMDFGPARRLRVRHLMPGVELAEVVRQTGFEIDVALEPLPAWTREEVRVLREDVDTAGVLRRKAGIQG